MVIYLYREIWPKIRKAQSGAEWHIYGAYLPQNIKQLHHPQKGIVVKGRADQVLQTMSSYKVMLAPLRFGAGLKGKYVDAMRSGTPSVTTEIGAEGIASSSEWPGFVENGSDEFAAKSVELYQNQQLWISKQQLAIKVLKQFDIKLYIDHFKVVLQDQYKHLKSKRTKNIVGELLKHHRHRSTKFMSLWIEEKNK
jgi:glycosyltransferase involved in cell wall biosynthesis